MGQDTKSIYRPRLPERTDLHQAVRENLHLFLETYDERFLDQHGPLTARACRTLEGYIRCGTCGHELLVAFSCQLRGVCPSCQQKRLDDLSRNDTHRHREESVQPTTSMTNPPFSRDNAAPPLASFKNE